MEAEITFDQRTGRALRRARANMRMSRNEAARQSGISASVLRKIECGEVTIKVSHLVTLADLYDTTPDLVTEFISRYQEGQHDRFVASLLTEVAELRAERDELENRVRGMMRGATRCGQPHWRRGDVICGLLPEHSGNHRNESVRLAWPVENPSGT